MLNKIIIMGRLTRDPELRRTQSGTAVASFALAVDRDYKDQATGERGVDFIDCVAWSHTGEFASRYCPRDAWLWRKAVFSCGIGWTGTGTSGAVPRSWWNRCISAIPRVKADRRVVSLCRRRPGIRRCIRPRAGRQTSSGNCRTMTENCRFREVRNVITVVIHVDAPVGQAIGVKEQLAMYLERFGNAKVVLVTEKEPEQLGLEGFE